MAEESSEYEGHSMSYRFDSRPPFPTDRSETSINYQELIRAALRDYDDVDDVEFEVLEDEPSSQTHSRIQGSYMHANRTLVPIGASFQVALLPMLTETAYRAKTAKQMEQLRKLKINDPTEEGQFYQKHLKLVMDKFGEARTYEDVNQLHNAYLKLNSKLKFEDYVVRNMKHWENVFRTKDRTMQAKTAAKKKRKKGTIPI